MTDKYLEARGFHAYIFGTYKDGCVDVESDFGPVATHVPVKQAEEIIRYLRDLGNRTQAYINTHYGRGA